MKAQTRIALNEIGWPTVVAKYPATAMNFAASLMLPPSGPKAKIDIEKIQDVEAAIKHLSSALANLSGQQIEDIDARITDCEENGYQDYPWVWEAFVNCQGLRLPLKEMRKAAETIVSNSGPGSVSPRTGQIRKARAPLSDDNFYKLATVLGEVYILGVRSRHKIGSDAQDGEPNGLFNRTLIKILDAEGHIVPVPNTVIAMSKAAKRELTTSKIKAILRENAKVRSRWEHTSWYSIKTREVMWRDYLEDELWLWQQVTQDF